MLILDKVRLARFSVVPMRDSDSVDFRQTKANSF